MKVKLLVGRCGPTVSDVAGDEIDVSAEEAKRMIAKGQCVALKARKKTEKATKADITEKAVA